MLHEPRRIVLCLILLGMAGPAHAGLIHDEMTDGDLSGDGLNPTSFVLTMGANVLAAESISGDREYVHFQIPTGMQLAAIMLEQWESEDELGFMAVQQGTTFTEPPTGTDVANLLGWTHFGPAALGVGADYMEALSTGPGSAGFTPPLPAGDYAFWIQQTGPTSAAYQLSFVVTPEPSSLLCGALAGMALLRRRRAA
jgi:hypothetical protein